MDMKKIIYAILVMLVAALLVVVSGAARQIGNYSHKVWLHRCNSIEKLREKEALYPNVEVDVVFREDNTFDVTHDLDKTFNLDLGEYFRHYQEREGKIWLDVKNLNGENKDSMLVALTGLLNRYGMAKERIIVESPEWEHLGVFTGNGFYTSMYVTFKKPWKLARGVKNSCLEQLRKVADSKKVCAISFPHWWYRTIREELGRDIDLLTWKNRTSQLVFLMSREGKKMLRDNQLKVVLVKDKGAFHR